MAALHVATDDAAYFEAIAGCLDVDRRFRPIAPFVPSPEEATDFERTFAAMGRSARRISVVKV